MARILVVDDDPAQRARWKHTLESDGHTVVTAADAIQGLVAITRDPPDLILSDILMPRMDGFTFIREVKSRPDLRTIPFLFVTATLVSDDDRQFAQMLGAEAILARADKSNAAPEIINAALKRHQRDEPPVTRAPARPRSFAVEDIAPEIETPPQSAFATADVTRPAAPATEQFQQRIAELEQAAVTLAQRAEENDALAGAREQVLQNLLSQTERLKERLNERTLFFAALSDVSRALCQNADPEPVLEQIVEHTALLTRVDSCSLFLFNAETATFHGAYSSALAREKIRAIFCASDAGGSIQSILRHGVTALCPSLPYLPEGLFPSDLNAHTALVAPIQAHDQVLGLMVCADAEAERVFTDDEIEIAAQFAEQASLALGNARLLYKVQRTRANELALDEESAEPPAAPRAAPDLAHLEKYRAQVAALAEIARSINTSLYPQTVLERIVRAAMELTHAETCNLFLHNPETRTFHGVASSSMPRESIQQLSFAADDNLPLTSVFRDHASLTLNDTDADTKQFPLLENAFHAKAALIVPIVARGQTLGVMLCVDSTSHRAYTREEVSLLTLLADQAALWLEAAHWFYETKQSRASIEPRAMQTLDQAKETALTLSEPLVAIFDQTHFMLAQSPDAETRLRIEDIEANTRRLAELIERLRHITQTPAYLDG